MDSPASSKRLRLGRPDRCAVCDHSLAVGDTAIWNRISGHVTCLGCSRGDAPVNEGWAGASARREYAYPRLRRESHARAKLGGLGVLLARVIEEPQSTRAWRQGADGEIRTAARLSKHLGDDEVRLLHDRRIPRHGRANIDHLAVGPGGITVIDSKTLRGRIRVEQVGGLFAPRKTVLLIDGRDRTTLVEGIERQLEYVRTAVASSASGPVGVRGALCFANPDGLPLLGQLRVRDIAIDGPKAVAKLARRSGPLSPESIEQLWQELARAFPPA